MASTSARPETLVESSEYTCINEKQRRTEVERYRALYGYPEDSTCQIESPFTHRLNKGKGNKDVP